MKIVFLSYYADFARFYIKLSEQLNHQGVKNDAIILSLFPSSHIYSSLHGVKSKFIPFNLRISKRSSTPNDPLKYSNYHKHIMGDVFDEELFKKIEKGYIGYYLKLFKKVKPDLVVVAGDSRLPSETLKSVCYDLNIKCLFFEQGPINTTILDSAGVNANCSFRNERNFSNNNKNLEIQFKKKPAKWTGYKKYRLFDYLFNFLGFAKLLPEFYGISTPVKLNKKLDKVKTLKKINQRQINRKARNFLLILQVPQDVNMIYHSPYFKTHSDLLKAVIFSLPDESNLSVREHPLFTGLYEDELYDCINKYNNVFLDAEKSLEDSFSKNDVVIVNNSTVGLEALLKNKPVVALGNSYYDDIVLKYDGSNLKELLGIACSKNFDWDMVRRRLNYLFEHNFLPGHFRDIDAANFATIVKKTFLNYVK